MNRNVAFSSVFALSLGLAACGGSTTTSTEPSTSSTAQAAMSKAPVAPQVKGHMRVLADALSEVPLRADQRTEIEKMATDAEARHAAARTAHAQIAEAIAAQIETGAIDRAALQPKIDAAVDSMAASRPADRAALERLHALLTPEQRTAFVDAIESHGKAKHEMHGDHHAHMEQWAADLKLTDDQKAQIGSVVKAQFMAHKGEMKEMHAAHEHGKDFMESFKNDQMTLPPQEDAHPRANKMADTFVGIVAQVLPLLTAEQRTLAAAKIREHAQNGMEEGAPVLGE